jgi:quinol monooxygenase YgiN
MIVVAKIKAKNGQEEAVEKVLRDLTANVKQEVGTVVYTLHRSQNDPALFMVYEKYSDAAAFELHGSTPYFQKAVAALMPLMDGGLEIEVYDELAAIT